jgi:hypothetical protein
MQVQAICASRPLPEFKAGDVLEVRMVVPEAGRKEYLYKGVCIARYNKGIRSAFKIYNHLPESGGFVQHLPLYMPGLLLPLSPLVIYLLSFLVSSGKVGSRYKLISSKKLYDRISGGISNLLVKVWSRKTVR